MAGRTWRSGKPEMSARHTLKWCAGHFYFFLFMPKLERKSFHVDVKADDQQGVIEAIVSVFNNRDRGDDIIRPGFFAESLKRKLPKGVWQHKWDQPVAKTVEARELLPGDALLPTGLKELGGLYIKAQFNLDTQRGKEAFSDIQFGIIDEFSIGYRSTKVAYDEDNDTRELLEGELYEWSPVLVGMNPATQLLSVKDADRPAGLTLADHSELVLATLAEYTERIASLTDIRAKEGRVISADNRQRLQHHCDCLTDTMNAMKTAYDELQSLMALAKPKRESETEDIPAKASPAQVMSEMARFLRASARFSYQ